MEIGPVWRELIHGDGQTDIHDEATIQFFSYILRKVTEDRVGKGPVQWSRHICVSLKLHCRARRNR